MAGAKHPASYVAKHSKSGCLLRCVRLKFASVFNSKIKTYYFAVGAFLSNGKSVPFLLYVVY